MLLRHRGALSDAGVVLVVELVGASHCGTRREGSSAIRPHPVSQRGGDVRKDLLLMDGD